MSNHITTDCALVSVLVSADEADLAILADFITDNDKGRMSLDAAIRVQISECKVKGTLKNNYELLAREIQEFGGNSIINFFRGKGVPYREILEDVANHMKVAFEKNAGIEEMELKILIAVAVKSMEKMSDDEQGSFIRDVSGGQIAGIGPATAAALQTYMLASGIGSRMLSTTVANAVATQLIGRGLTIVPTHGASRMLAAFAGPIGWAITAAWAAFDMASPAYRVTVPCVIQIAYMRQKAKRGNDARCTRCDTPNDPGAKFCSECGAPMAVNQ